MLSRVEGASLLALLLVAMPLKHVFDRPEAVRVAGTVHGVLFLALVSAGFQVAAANLRPWAFVMRVVGWSFVPFGFLVVDRHLRAETAELRRDSPA